LRPPDLAHLAGGVADDQRIVVIKLRHEQEAGWG
jgi:hypothetical protein